MNNKEVAKIAVPCVVAFLIGDWVGVKRANTHIKRRIRRKAKDAKNTDVVKEISRFLADPNDDRTLNDVVRDWYYTNEIKSIYEAK